jgi:hypothetical protein
MNKKDILAGANPVDYLAVNQALCFAIGSSDVGFPS